ncbi:MAG: TIGR02680 family protein [Acidimicrobiales bacterium]
MTTIAAAPTPVSQTPPTQRWTPTRAGLVALWRYWDETFTFHAGRLLLRGPNGSGKSMALELLLPFLLDGDASPSRLTSSTKSRGGLYERVMAGGDDPGRTGFAWVEFRRGDDEVFTVGARLRASASARKVETTLFTTTQAVGTELQLLDESREPLSGKALKAAIGDRGQVNSTAADHRKAIRDQLFPGFSEDRYASVITALLALRKEKLSQNLDLAKLSEVLTDALPPIDEHELAVVAEGFERLDRRRDELSALEAEVAAVAALARRQRTYARAVVAGVADEVREAESRRDSITRAEREASSALQEAVDRDRSAETQARVLDDRLADIEVEVETRHASKAYRKGVELDHLRGEERQRREQADRDHRAVAERSAAVTTRASELGQAEDLRQAAAGNLTTASDDVHQVASGLGADHLRQEMSAASDAGAGEAFGLAWVGARRRQIGEVRRAIGRHSDAVMRRGFEEELLSGDQEAYDRALTVLSEAESAQRAMSESYDSDVAGWARTSIALDTDQVLGDLGRPPFEPEEVETVVNRLRTALEAGHAVAIRDLEELRHEVVDRQSSLLDEKAHLDAGRQSDPEPPTWRDNREGRSGAPLWRLVELMPGVGRAEVDGVEAALDAAGLLDAWVSPDGVVDVSAHDLELVPGAEKAEVGGRTLADILVPLAGGAVASDRVAAVLASIPVGPHAGPIDAGEGAEVLIGTDGSFRLGSAVGRAPDSPAILLGAEARERRRLQRLSEVGAALAEVEAELDRIQRARDGLDRDRRAADAHLDALPSSAPLRQAVRDAEAASQRVVDAEGRVEASAIRLRAAEASVREALRSLTSAAAGHGLPTTPDDLDRVEEELFHLERTIHTWAKRSHELAGAQLRLFDRSTAHTEATELFAAAEKTSARSRREAKDAKVRLDTLDATAGVEHKTVLAELERLQEESRKSKSARQDLEDARRALSRQIGTLTTTVAQAEQERVEAGTRRDAAHERFVALAGDGLLAEAEVGHDGSLDGVTAVLAAARAVAAELEDGSDDPARQRSSSQVDDSLHAARAALSGHADLSRQLGEHGWWVLRTTVNGFRQSVLALHRKLQIDLSEGRADLAAEEERLFEQTLAGSIRRSLANRIRQANHLVAGINDQLGAVRTAAAGVAVRLHWEVDPDQPAAVRSARSLLLKDRVTDEERRDLQEFVRARVDQARAELEHHAPWEARLRESLDYRAWHRFTLQVSHRDWEGWQPATPKRMQRLSTGERSIALHLPMLASIAAHYTDEDGRPSGCPRLILLDELFAGVDAANRAMLFGTFTDWDLDAVFTSDHEWCQYATLSGIAIHHLHPPDGDGPLVSTRFTWDGRRRVIDSSAA